MSPRQRMINIMYIVLTALLALHVSRDVLNGFNQMHDSLERTNDNMSAKNSIQFEYLQELYSKNPVKVGPWLEKGEILRNNTILLLTQIDSLKQAIAIEADGRDGNPDHLKKIDNLEAASLTMLNPITKNGRRLRQNIEKYKETVTSLISDSLKRLTVSEILSTEIKNKKGNAEISWENDLFDKTPAIAAVTLLTKLQNDIMESESEALSSIITNVDIGDVRVNELNPYVIPSSNLVMKGGTYKADIVLAAIDTTQRPSVFVNDRKIENGHLEIPASSIGNHDYSGYIEILKGDGSIDRKTFSSTFNVIEPMATVSATMMNVLYAGIDNPISISVPGVAMSSLEASMTNGMLSRNGNTWVARPSKINQDAVISVFASLEGRRQQVGSMTFRVRQLPDPSPYLPVKDSQGNIIHYKGSPKKISKAQLMGVESIEAAIDDNLLNVTYSVISFSTVFFDSMGNGIPEVSNGNNFSQRQKEQLKRLKPGSRFFISNVKAKGPDGVTRDISPLEVSLN